MTSGCHHCRPVQTCSIQDPLVLTLGGYWSVHSRHKQTVRILLECFLVANDETAKHIDGVQFSLYIQNFHFNCLYPAMIFQLYKIFKHSTEGLFCVPVCWIACEAGLKIVTENCSQFPHLCTEIFRVWQVNIFFERRSTIEKQSVLNLCWTIVRIYQKFNNERWFFVHMIQDNSWSVEVNTSKSFPLQNVMVLLWPVR